MIWIFLRSLRGSCLSRFRFRCRLRPSSSLFLLRSRQEPGRRLLRRPGRRQQRLRVERHNHRAAGHTVVSDRFRDRGLVVYRLMDSLRFIQYWSFSSWSAPCYFKRYIQLLNWMVHIKSNMNCCLLVYGWILLLWKLFRFFLIGILGFLYKAALLRSWSIFPFIDWHSSE